MVVCRDGFGVDRDIRAAGGIVDIPILYNQIVRAVLRSSVLDLVDRIGEDAALEAGGDRERRAHIAVVICFDDGIVIIDFYIRVSSFPADSIEVDLSDAGACDAAVVICRGNRDLCLILEEVDVVIGGHRVIRNAALSQRLTDLLFFGFICFLT